MLTCVLVVAPRRGYRPASGEPCSPLPPIAVLVLALVRGSSSQAGELRSIGIRARRLGRLPEIGPAPVMTLPSRSAWRSARATGSRLGARWPRSRARPAWCCRCRAPLVRPRRDVWSWSASAGAGCWRPLPPRCGAGRHRADDGRLRPPGRAAVPLDIASRSLSRLGSGGSILAERPLSGWGRRPIAASMAATTTAGESPRDSRRRPVSRPQRISALRRDRVLGVTTALWFGRGVAGRERARPGANVAAARMAGLWPHRRGGPSARRLLRSGRARDARDAVAGDRRGAAAGAREPPARDPGLSPSVTGATRAGRATRSATRRASSTARGRCRRSTAPAGARPRPCAS